VTIATTSTHRGAACSARLSCSRSQVPFFPLGGFTPLQSTVLSDVALECERTPMQVALAWLLQRAPNILLIPGTSSLDHLRENLAAASLQLPPASISALNGIASASALGS